MDAAAALEHHVSFLASLAFLEGRTPQDLERVPERFEPIVGMVRELRLEQMLLPASIPVYWTRDTSQAITSITTAIDLAQIECDRDLVYCDSACCWFEQPFVFVPDKDAPDTAIEAISWWFVEFRESANKPMQRALGVTGWGHHVDDSYLTPIVWLRIPAGQRLDEACDYETEAYKQAATACLRFVVAAGMFMRQKLAAAESTQVHRHARKRLQARGWTRGAVIDVIRLRARETGIRVPSHAPDDRQYHFQWLVRSHVRQQWYPSLNRHLPVLLGPYVKGPIDKPFKPRSTPLVVVDR